MYKILTDKLLSANVQLFQLFLNNLLAWGEGHNWNFMLKCSTMQCNALSPANAPKMPDKYCSPQTSACAFLAMGICRD